MNKFIKATSFALLLAGSATLLAGCGDNKPAPASPKPQQTAQQQNKQQAPKKKPVPTSKLYRFGVHIDDEKAIPQITPEITAKFEKYASNFDLPEKDTKHQIEGIWVYKASPLSKGAQIFSHWWTLNLSGHHATKFEYTDKKGKTRKGEEQHIAHIQITVDVKSNKMKSARVYRYDLTEENPQGTTTEIVKETF